MTSPQTNGKKLRREIGKGVGAMVSVFFNAVSAVVVLLLLMAVGYWMGQLGWMGSSEKKFLGKYLINIAVPCNCLTGILNNLDRSMLSQAAMMLANCMLGVVLNFAIGMTIAAAMKIQRNRWGVFVSMLALPNSLFIGLPMCTQLFGEVCVPYVMLYYLSNTIFTQSVALLLVERSGSVKKEKQGVGKAILALVSKPPIVAMAVSLVLLVSGIRPPEFIMSFAKYISGSVSPLALMYCGCIVCELGLKNLRFQRGLGVMMVFRLVLAPILCAFMCRFSGITGLAHDVFVVSSGLPVVTQITVMAGTYGADEQYAATGATFTTLGCFLTIPVIMVLLA